MSLCPDSDDTDVGILNLYQWHAIVNIIWWYLTLLVFSGRCVKGPNSLLASSVASRLPGSPP